MYIPNDHAQNYPLYRLHLVLKRLDTQLNKLTNQNPIKVSIIVKQLNSLLRNKSVYLYWCTGLDWWQLECCFDSAAAAALTALLEAAGEAPAARLLPVDSTKGSVWLALARWSWLVSLSSIGRSSVAACESLASCSAAVAAVLIMVGWWSSSVCWLSGLSTPDSETINKIIFGAKCTKLKKYLILTKLLN